MWVTDSATVRDYKRNRLAYRFPSKEMNAPPVNVLPVANELARPGRLQATQNLSLLVGRQLSYPGAFDHA